MAHTALLLGELVLGRPPCHHPPLPLNKAWEGSGGPSGSQPLLSRS